MSEVPRLRYTARTIARPMPISAAAMAMVKRVRAWPECSVSRQPDVEGDEVEVDGVEHQLDGHQDQDRVAAREDSVQARAEEEGGEHGGIGEVHQRLLPVACSPAASGRPRTGGAVGVAGVRLRLAGQDDRADQGGEEEDGERFEGQDPVLEEARSGHLGGARGGAVQVDPGGAEGVDDDPDQGAGRGDGHGQGGPAVAGVGVRGAADRGPGEHQTEQEEDDDGTDVDEDLHPGDELGRQQQVFDGEAAEGDHQPQGGVHQLLGGDGDEGRAEGDQADEEEGDLDAGRGEEAVVSGGR